MKGIEEVPYFRQGMLSLTPSTAPLPGLAGWGDWEPGSGKHGWFSVSDGEMTSSTSHCRRTSSDWEGIGDRKPKQTVNAAIEALRQHVEQGKYGVVVMVVVVVVWWWGSVVRKMLGGSICRVCSLPVGNLEQAQPNLHSVCPS